MNVRIPSSFVHRALLALLVSALLEGCAPPSSFKVTAISPDQTLKEQIVYRHPGWVSNRIAIIDISGILLNAYEPKLFSKGEHSVSLLVEQLEAAASDKRVKAVVLRINSPGGSVTASDAMYEEILAFRKKTGKPVVACFQDVAASGAYYLACAADEIIAQRTSVTGSLGVVMQMVDLSGTLAKLGIRAEAITSGPFKDAGSPFRVMRPEEREVFQGMVDTFYRRFIEVIVEGRPDLSREQIVKLADGRVYTAEQALESGLVDRIATLREAVVIARERAGIKAAHAILYRRPLAWRPTLYARSPASTINLINIILPKDWTKRPRFMYIWSVED